MSTIGELGSSWDATETSARIRSRDVSANEVVEAAIARAEAAEPLGAIVTRSFERAREAKPERGTLSGVPTFVKDLAQLRGVATTWGSRASREYVSRKTDPFVTRFEETGLVTLGKSATPELGLVPTTERLGKRPTRNPWDHRRSPGGSSGGAAALVAAGVVPMAHASDGGGSIRIPASCCGLVGLKPSRRRIDMDGSNLLPLNIATNGVVTRTVRDTVMFYEAFEALHAPKGVRPIGGRPAPRKSLRIGMYVDAPNGTPVDTEVRDAVRAAGRLSESLGHRVEEIAFPFDASFVDDFLAYWGFVAWLQVKTARVMMHWNFDGSKLEPWTVGIAATFARSPRETFAAMARLRRFSATYDEALAPFDVFLSPVCAEPAPKLGYLQTDQPFETLFNRLKAYCPFTPIHNAAGTPSIALPLGRSSEGLPIGVQFSGAHGDDGLLLDLALSLEEASPWQRIATPIRDDAES